MTIECHKIYEYKKRFKLLIRITFKNSLFFILIYNYDYLLLRYNSNLYNNIRLFQYYDVTICIERSNSQISEYLIIFSDIIDKELHSSMRF